MKHKHHSIDYIEFTVSDMKASKEFYRSIFDWDFTDYAPGYAGIKGEDKEIGGFSVGTPSPGGPLLVFYSENLEESLAKVRAVDGEISKDIFDFPGGRRFQFFDPDGLELAVWSEPK